MSKSHIDVVLTCWMESVGASLASMENLGESS